MHVLQQITALPDVASVAAGCGAFNPRTGSMGLDVLITVHAGEALAVRTYLDTSDDTHTADRLVAREVIRDLRLQLMRRLWDQRRV